MKNTNNFVRNIIAFLTLAIISTALASVAAAQTTTTIANFSFNSASGCQATTDVTASNVTSAFSASEAVCTNPTGAATTSSSFATNPAGTSVSITGASSNNPKYFQFSLGGTGLGMLSGYTVYLQTQRTSTGPATATFQYSTDGVNFTNFQAISVGTTFGASIFDLSQVTALNNQRDVIFRVSTGTFGTTGAFRIDNFQVQATSYPPTAALVTVGGRVTNSATGNGLANCVVNLTSMTTGNEATTTTDANGYWSFQDSIEVGNTYIAMPVLKRFTFSPSQTVINLTEEMRDVDFVGTEVPRYQF